MSIHLSDIGLEFDQEIVEDIMDMFGVNYDND